MGTDTSKPVLILGAGINGAALARELALNGIPVRVVDCNDLAFGATSKSSRLIHGGLRYLEYGDFRLVKESLDERTILHKLVPQFVEPLRLFIPVRTRFSGLLMSAARFLGKGRWFRRWAGGSQDRGLWLVRMGLWLYDVLARSPDFPKHSISSLPSPSVPKVDGTRYRWLCAYTDAQMRLPERFVVALLEDASRLAAKTGADFQVLTHHSVSLRDTTAVIRKLGSEEIVAEIEPALLVNATGSWGDLTLRELGIASKRLFGGTKGSHFITHHRGLRSALGDDGLYAEAEDGRLIFVLPFGDSVLVGTTDERFEGSPADAVATPEELAYLRQMVNDLFPDVELNETDVDVHYCGVRPLPNSSDATAAAIPRGHWIDVNEEGALATMTLIGGKLTTCRAFAEEAATLVANRLGATICENSRERPVPGGADYPTDEQAVRDTCNRLAERFKISPLQIHAIWELCGNRVNEILSDVADLDRTNLPGTDLPLAYVQWVIEHEWATRIEDLIERRLMLVYHPSLSEECLQSLADCLIEAGHLADSDRDGAVETAIDRLRAHYGKKVIRTASADGAERTAESRTT